MFGMPSFGRAVPNFVQRAAQSLAGWKYTQADFAEYKADSDFEDQIAAAAESLAEAEAALTRRRKHRHHGRHRHAGHARDENQTHRHRRLSAPTSGTSKMRDNDTNASETADAGSSSDMIEQGDGQTSHKTARDDISAADDQSGILPKTRTGTSGASPSADNQPISDADPTCSSSDASDYDTDAESDDSLSSQPRTASPERIKLPATAADRILCAKRQARDAAIAAAFAAAEAYEVQTRLAASQAMLASVVSNRILGRDALRVPEIVSRVFDYLGPADLARVSPVCRVWSLLATPRVYRCIKLESTGLATDIQCRKLRDAVDPLARYRTTCVRRVSLMRQSQAGIVYDKIRSRVQGMVEYYSNMAALRGVHETLQNALQDTKDAGKSLWDAWSPIAWVKRAVAGSLESLTPSSSTTNAPACIPAAGSAGTALAATNDDKDYAHDFTNLLLAETYPRSPPDNETAARLKADRQNAASIFKLTCKHQRRDMGSFHKPQPWAAPHSGDLGSLIAQLSFVKLLVTDKILSSILTYTPNLTHLTIADCALATSRPVITASAIAANSLLYLHLDSLGMCFGDDALHAVSDTCHRLQYLQASNCPGISSHGLACVFYECTDLRTVILNHLDADFDSALHLDTFTVMLLADNCDRLEYLDIAGCHIAETDLIRLYRKRRAGMLRSLALGFNHTGSRLLENIASYIHRITGEQVRGLIAHDSQTLVFNLAGTPRPRSSELKHAGFNLIIKTHSDENLERMYAWTRMVPWSASSLARLAKLRLIQFPGCRSEFPVVHLPPILSRVPGGLPQVLITAPPPRPLPVSLACTPAVTPQSSSATLVVDEPDTTSDLVNHPVAIT
ncbi:hypothetical protein BC831DRAFT_512491 [Entophlyctis helioformis]|nr:hypothetical protein BC831DRAFT_512491 [Entophlyctis helioformis]